MSIVFCDGFEQYEVFNDISKGYPSATDNSTLVDTTALGRGKALRMGSSVLGSLRSTIPEQPLNGVVGNSARIRVVTPPSASDRKYICAFLENGIIHFALYLGTDGSLRPFIGGTLLGNTSYQMSFNTWYHVEVKYSCDTVNGYCEIRIDGNTIFIFNGDTRNAGTGLINVVSLIANTVGGAGEVDIDDFITWDSSGDSENDWIGDCEVQTSFPTANHVVTGWTPNIGTEWEAIDDTGEDGDTTFISSNVVGSTASFEMGNLLGSPTQVLAVQVFGVAAKSDTGERSIKLGINSNDVIAEGSATSLGLSYSGLRAIFSKNPDGNVVWNPTTVNSLKSQVSVTA